MRNTFPLMIAIAMVAAVPATAQGTDNSMNAGDVATTTTTNDAAGSVTTDPAAAANDMTAAPLDQPLESTYNEPAPAKPASFPWGVLGLLGLVGLLGRKRA